MEQVDVDGLRIAFQRAGNGPPLLLLHGAVSDSRVWRVELQSFADEFTVVAWDAPGCGTSADPPDDFAMGDYAACLAALVDALSLEPARVLGHSWGSTLALELFRQRPDLVRSLVLVGAYAGWAGSLPPDEVEQRLAAALEAADAGEGAFDPQSVRGLFSDVMPADRAEELALIMSATRPCTTRSMAKAMAAADLRAELPAITVPTLIVHGSDDTRSPSAVAEQLHAAIRRSELVVLPGLGHESYLESASAFDAAVRPFLRAT